MTVASGVANITCSLNKVGSGYTIVASSSPDYGGATSHSFDIVSLDSMTSTRQSPDATQLGSFRRWQDPQWKRMTVALR